MTGQDEITSQLRETQDLLEKVLHLHTQLVDQVSQGDSFRLGIIATHVSHALAEIDHVLTTRCR